MFVGCSTYCLYVYSKQMSLFESPDLGIVQKWVQVMIGQLIFFDDPFVVLSVFFSDLGWLYYLYQGFVESLFISILLLFWLIIIHSMSTNRADGQIDISPNKFFFPKLGICFAYFIQLVVMRIYVYVQFA